MANPYTTQALRVSLLPLLLAAALVLGGSLTPALAQHDHGGGATHQMPSGETMPGMDMGGAAAPGSWASHWQVWAALIVVVLFVVFTILRRAGPLRRVSAGIGGGVALLLVGYFATSYLVARYRQPGQMTLLEANIMDMSSMRPLAGSVPVATEGYPRPFRLGRHLHRHGRSAQ